MVKLKPYPQRMLTEEDILLDLYKPIKFIYYDGINSGWLIYEHKEDKRRYRDFMTYELAKMLIDKTLQKKLTGKFYEGYKNILDSFKKGRVSKKEAMRLIKSLLGKENPEVLLITNPEEKDKGECYAIIDEEQKKRYNAKQEVKKELGKEDRDWSKIIKLIKQFDLYDEFNIFKLLELMFKDGYFDFDFILTLKDKNFLKEKDFVKITSMILEKDIYEAVSFVSKANLKPNLLKRIVIENIDEGHITDIIGFMENLNVDWRKIFTKEEATDLLEKVLKATHFRGLRGKLFADIFGLEKEYHKIRQKYGWELPEEEKEID
ncbi:MAG: hypothetical protein QXO40_00330 [Candidatus Aenigmatarchaeota archaeon]